MLVLDENQGENIQMFQPGLVPGSYSGLPEGYRDSFLNTLMPKLNEGINNYNTNIDTAYNLADQRALSTAKKSMREGAGSILNNLANRNVLNSTVASDALSKGMSDISNQAADRSYQAGSAAAAMKANYPSVLGNLAQLGSYSEQNDPLDPYRLVSNMFMGMQ